MKRIPWLLSLFIILLTTACESSAEQLGTIVAFAQTATTAAWTETPSSSWTFTPSSSDTPSLTFTPSSTFTPSATPTMTLTPTSTSSPTRTSTSTFTPSPTFDFPKVTVDQKFAHAACMWGPSTEYLWGWDLKAGDTGIVYGRSPYNKWLYVKMERVDKYCWIGPLVVDVSGDPARVGYRDKNFALPMTNTLYAAPTGVRATRDGDQVTVSWNAVWMTLDDDRGYFLDVFVCQKGKYVWMPEGRLALPDQNHTSFTFTDQPGCASPSGGQLYTVEKHGYTSPVTIPWP